VVSFILVIISFSFISQIPDLQINEIQKAPLLVKQNCFSYTIHEPFNITSDTDFEIQAWPGNGSETNPYLIENLNITTSNSTCIWIMNTTSHFAIKNCYFTSPVYDYTQTHPICPITLSNVSNGVIVGNQIVDGLGAIVGFRLTDCNITDNTLRASYHAISISHSNSTIISKNNQGYEPCDIGFSLTGCRNCTISLNGFKNITNSGIMIWNSFDIQVIENSFTGHLGTYFSAYQGIWILGGECLTIRKNMVSTFNIFGIGVDGEKNIVEYNNVSSCTIGIMLSANNCTIKNNVLGGNFVAIEMVQTNSTKVFDNIIDGFNGIYETGIAMYGGHDSEIFLNNINRVGLGLYLQGATGFNVSFNSVTSSRYGFAFGTYSNWGVPEGPFSNCDIVNNSFDHGGVYPVIEEYDSWEFSTIRFLNNTVNNKPIGFFTQLDGSVLQGEDYGQVILILCNDVILTGGNYYGIISDRYWNEFHDPGMASALVLIGCQGCEIGDVSFHNNTIGINVQYSTDILILSLLGYDNNWAASIIWHSETVVLSGCYFRNNLKGIASGWSIDIRIFNGLIWENNEGIVLTNSPNSTILNVDISENEDAIFLGDSDICNIKGNNIYWNTRGILLNSSSDCIITRNEVYNNTGVGICLDLTSHRNEIYDNVFAYNNPNAICSGTSNHWDDQIDTGNWWSDYSGDGPYIIDEDDQDNFPIVNHTIPSRTIPIDSWINELVLFGIAGGLIGILAVIIILVERRRVTIID